MKGIQIIQSTAVPLPVDNVDTDQIIPARFLKATSREGFGENMFRDWRYDAEGNPITGSVFHNALYQGRILLTGENFGCGSSREHAAWAIKDYGFDAVVSSSFADIFRNNSLNNFLLPVEVSESFVKTLTAAVLQNPSLEIVIDLPAQEIRCEALGLSERFPVNAYKKTCLINGYDDIDYLLSMRQEIEEFEKQRAL